jgi:hypothetical protein
MQPILTLHMHEQKRPQPRPASPLRPASYLAPPPWAGRRSPPPPSPPPPPPRAPRAQSQPEGLRRGLHFWAGPG